MSNHLLENWVLLVVNAIRLIPYLSIRRAVKMYNVPKTTIIDRIKGYTVKSDSYNARSNLTKIEKEVIV